MTEVRSVELKRDCEAVRIPAGTPVVLPAGTAVDITQALGGTYTVMAAGGLFRIGGADADALGLAPGAVKAMANADAGGEAAADLEARVWETLRSCYDPEIPVNIVDLGLVYDLRINPSEGNGRHVAVKMTLTAPGCGMGTVIAGDAQQKLLYLPGVSAADVEIVWDPPWHQSMITPEGRRILGLE
jgi:probable FeS assembly SUF system protein SufT